MPDAVGSVIRRAALARVPASSPGRSAAAQQPLARSAWHAEFLSRYDFHLSAAARLRRSSDSRGTRTGAAISTSSITSSAALTVSGRLPGDDRRTSSGRSIPNQSIYMLEASASLRQAPTELAGVLHHVSRHLGDRPNAAGDRLNNVLGGRVLRRIRRRTAPRSTCGRCSAWSSRARTWTTPGWAQRRRRGPAARSRSGSACYGRGFGETYGVDRDDRRPRPAGGRPRSKRGVRIAGQGGRAGAVRRLRTGGRRRSAGPAARPLGIRAGFASSEVRPLEGITLESTSCSAPSCVRRRGRVVLAYGRRSVGRRAAAQAAVRHLDAAERADGDPLRGSLDADRPRAALVSRRLEEREDGAHRVRASLRAHDVQGLEERGARGAHLVHLVGRRPEPTPTRPTMKRCSGRRCRRSICRWRCGSKPTEWRRCASTRTRSSTNARW